MKTLLITGSAGFIGFHLVKRLMDKGYHIVGVDSLSDYYDVRLKQSRLDELEKYHLAKSSAAGSSYKFVKFDISDKAPLFELFKNEKFDYIFHLAAQAGVRYSLKNPQSYIDSNIQGFFNILEACRAYMPEHLIFASSSSVYGLNGQLPFSASHHTDHPVSLYAATKKANEMMAHSYSHLFRIPVTGLRFFTVYGPWGRPDMACFSFTKKILAGEAIEIYNNGNLSRDFTYIDDIVNALVLLTNKAPIEDSSFNTLSPDPSVSSAPYKIFNIGNNSPVKLMDFIKILEDALGIKAKKIFLPMQPGDVHATYADIDDLTNLTGFRPVTSIETGLKKFVEWYRGYYKPEGNREV